jgi:hypothetical protein
MIFSRVLVVFHGRPYVLVNTSVFSFTYQNTILLSIYYKFTTFQISDSQNSTPGSTFKKTGLLHHKMDATKAPALGFDSDHFASTYAPRSLTWAYRKVVEGSCMLRPPPPPPAPPPPPPRPRPPPTRITVNLNGMAEFEVEGEELCEDEWIDY